MFRTSQSKNKTLQGTAGEQRFIITLCSGDSVDGSEPIQALILEAVPIESQRSSLSPLSTLPMFHSCSSSSLEHLVWPGATWQAQSTSIIPLCSAGSFPLASHGASLDLPILGRRRDGPLCQLHRRPENSTQCSQKLQGDAFMPLPFWATGFLSG